LLQVNLDFLVNSKLVGTNSSRIALKTDFLKMWENAIGCWNKKY